ncbi:hypothetical protein GMES_1307 [Paraglaciecola mesophila KMM 241]|uniref:Uncharacterized protein n=1 Tax=Paraglaciecola mesophila KMM 241 TaxID=1128912 RepID=K6YHY7_9ALTE|nr:hypothetical protein GMES_1307 [Paraglaciecola mesophila KMM 241]
MRQSALLFYSVLNMGSYSIYLGTKSLPNGTTSSLIALSDRHLTQTYYYKVKS